MSKTTAIVLLGVAVCACNALVTAQGSRGKGPARPATAASSRVGSSAPVLVGSIKEIMDGIVDPDCHVKCWYPKDKKPAVDALSRRRR